jgi:hypothetical protein
MAKSQKRWTAEEKLKIPVILTEANSQTGFLIMPLEGHCCAVAASLLVMGYQVRYGHKLLPLPLPLQIRIASQVDKRGLL